MTEDIKWIFFYFINYLIFVLCCRSAYEQFDYHFKVYCVKIEFLFEILVDTLTFK